MFRLKKEQNLYVYPIINVILLKLYVCFKLYSKSEMFTQITFLSLSLVKRSCEDVIVTVS